MLRYSFLKPFPTNKKMCQKSRSESGIFGLRSDNHHDSSAMLSSGKVMNRNSKTTQNLQLTAFRWVCSEEVWYQKNQVQKFGPKNYVGMQIFPRKFKRPECKINSTVDPREDDVVLNRKHCNQKEYTEYRQHVTAITKEEVMCLRVLGNNSPRIET